MTLQETTLRRFREHYPNHSFKQISELTGIQSTRVFRLFNGLEMKLTEFQAFDQLLGSTSKTARNEDLLELTELLLNFFSKEERQYFALYLQREIYKQELKTEAAKVELRSQYV